MKSITVKNRSEVPKNYTGHVKYTSGNQYWYKNSKVHREDGPAVLFADGGQYWCKDGKFHREDGPAIVNVYGNYWYLDDDYYNKNDFYRELHRRGKISDGELFVELL